MPIENRDKVVESLEFFVTNVLSGEWDPNMLTEKAAKIYDEAEGYYTEDQEFPDSLLEEYLTLQSMDDIRTPPSAEDIEAAEKARAEFLESPAGQEYLGQSIREEDAWKAVHED